MIPTTQPTPSPDDTLDIPIIWEDPDDEHERPTLPNVPADEKEQT